MNNKDELALHPLVRQMIQEGTRDKPLTLNWAPVERDALDCLKLPDLSPLAMKARKQVIAEALVAGGRFISYSRNRNHYTAQRYYRETHTFRAVIPAVDQLDAEGLIEHEKMMPGSRGLQSRFRPSADLLRAFEKAAVVYKPLETIILRDATGNPVGYLDNRETRQMRRRMTEVNEALTSQKIGLKDRIIREGDRLDNGGRAQAQMHRVFHRCDWDNGGRLYGAFWQNMPPIDGRDQITINGRQTTELDYKGLHIRLLYQEAGKAMPDDPYDIDGWPRQQVKLATLIAVNARTHCSAVRALADALRLDGVSDPFETADRLIRATKARHPDIAWAFGSDAGVRLMRRDSEIALQVMLEMIRATGIAPLPIHDSFIVPIDHEDKLKEAMETAFSCKNTAPKISCKNAPHFRDIVSSGNTSGNLQNDLTIWDGEADGLLPPGMDLAWIAAQRTWLDDLAKRSERFKPDYRDELMIHVANVVKQQLDELDARRAKASQ